MNQFLKLFLNFFFFFGITLLPQNPEWINYTNGDEINTIEAEGNFIWIGTNGGGLVKIDSYSGETTFFDKSNSGLPTNNITCLAIDEEGNKWIGTYYGGLSKFDGENWITFNTLNSDLPSDLIGNIAIDSTNNKWIGFAIYHETGGEGNKDGLVRFDDNNWTTFYKSNSKLSGDNVYCITIDEMGNKWVGTDEGLTIISDTLWTVYNTSNSGLPDNYIFDLAIDGNGDKWINSSGFLVEFDGANWKIHNSDDAGIPYGGVRCIAVDDSDTKWIGTYNGIFKYDGENEIFFHDSSTGLINYSVSVIVIDVSGNKWFGTSAYTDGFDKKGLVKFDGASWKRYNTSSSSLPDNKILSLAIDNSGNKWIGTGGGGLAEFNGTNWTIYNTSNSDIPDNWIRSIAVDKDDHKWIAISGVCVGCSGPGPRIEGLAKFDGSSWSYYNSANSNLPSDFVYSIAVDDSNNKWIGTFDGLAKFDGNNWTIYNTSNSGLPSNIINSLSIDKDGNKWIGTGSGYDGKGLVKFDDANWTVYNSNNSDLPYNNVTCITIDEVNNKWIGTTEFLWWGGGLTKFNDNVWTTYDISNSNLPSDRITSLVIDGAGDLWIGTGMFANGSRTGNGIAKFDGANWDVYSETNSGLAINSINQITIDKYSNKWIGTNGGGLSVFNESGFVSVKEKEKVKKNIPTKYTLSQNYPNPFNPSTTIKYSIPKQSNVTLKVFDLLGSEEATLVNKEQSPGIYEVEFDASTSSATGSELTSGIYFYRLKAGDFIKTKKMILLK